MMDYEEIKERLLRHELKKTETYNPDEVYEIAASQLALTWMRHKFGRGVVRSQVYVLPDDIGMVLPDDKAVSVVVEIVPIQELLDKQPGERE